MLSRLSSLFMSSDSRFQPQTLFEIVPLQGIERRILYHSYVPRHNLWFIYVYACETPDNVNPSFPQMSPHDLSCLYDRLYLFDGKTGEWWANKTDSATRVHCSDSEVTMSRRDNTGTCIQVWTICDKEKGATSLQSRQSASSSLTMRDFVCPWYRVVDVNSVNQIDHGRPFTLLRYNGTAHAQLQHKDRGKDHELSLNLSLAPPYLILTKTSDTHSRLSMLNISNLGAPIEVVMDVPVAMTCLSRDSFENDWQVFMEPAFTGYRLQFWNRRRNIWAERHLDYIPRYSRSLGPQNLDSCHHDSSADVMVFMTSTAILVVPNFENELASPNMFLNHCAQYIDLSPWHDDTHISHISFADGRAVVELKHVYSNGGMSQSASSQYQLSSLIAIDFSNAFAISILAMAVPPIFGMTMDRDAIHCSMYTRFFASENANLVKQCEKLNDAKLRSLHQDGIAWRTYDRRSFPAYQHPQPHVSPTDSELINIRNFAMKYQDSGEGYPGILLFKFENLKN